MALWEQSRGRSVTTAGGRAGPRAGPGLRSEGNRALSSDILTPVGLSSLAGVSASGTQVKGTFEGLGHPWGHRRRGGFSACPDPPNPIRDSKVGRHTRLQGQCRHSQRLRSPPPAPPAASLWGIPSFLPSSHLHSSSALNVSIQPPAFAQV